LSYIFGVPYGVGKAASNSGSASAKDNRFLLYKGDRALGIMRMMGD
jgi:hypothetical protein